MTRTPVAVEVPTWTLVKPLTTTPPTPLAVAVNTFSLSLFKQLSDNNNNDSTSNVFYSPLSISSALAMVLLGARGNTATEMSEVLHFKDDVHADVSKLMDDLTKPGTSYALSLANRLYVEQSYQFVEELLVEELELLGSTREDYDTQLEPVDFIGDAEGARLSMNSWVEKQTQDKIKDLLAPGAVDERTRLLLVSAIHFKSKWDKSFPEGSTRDEKFRLSKTEAELSKPVKMMYQESKFHLGFIPEVRCQVLELPCAGKDLSMLVFLPLEMEDYTTGLERLEKLLTYERFMDWTHPRKMKYLTVDLGLPRFKMEETCDMKDILIEMGMEDAFDVAENDFSGMSPAKDLVLSQVVHKACVEVDEEGIEAAAVTVTPRLTICEIRKVPVRFVADHPFLFFIRHNPTMSTLFAGRYCSPP